MWSGWAESIAGDLETVTHRPVRAPLFAMFGYDAATRTARVGGGLISTPMARLRVMTVAVLLGEGVPVAAAEAAVAGTWHAPDPIGLAHPLADLPELLGGLRAAGRRIAIATSDDREPTERTIQALGIGPLTDALVCADDGVAGKPAPDPVLHVCAALRIEPGRTAVVGDSPADIAMGRAASVGLVVGVRTGVGDDTDLAAADVVVDSIAELEHVLA